MRRLAVLVVASAVLVASCSSGQAAETTLMPTTSVATSTLPATTVAERITTTTAEAATGPTTTDGNDALLADRPFDVFVPSSYDADTPMPLVVLLHGLGASGAIQEAYFQFQPLAEQRGFLYVHPDGTLNVINRLSWNATNACCGFGASVDDSAYLTALVQNVQANYNVDPKRIFFAGHSNGGFMSYRMACDHADMVAAIASLAGATWDDTTKCDPSEPVSVLQIHGTADGTISFEGGQFVGNRYPSAQQTVETWAGYNDCAEPASDLPSPRDLVASIPGDESTLSQFGGCAVGGAVQLWTMPGAPHIPALSPTFSSDVIDFLFAHPKP
jgi:polyhydroxybutyrate depolymerase